MFCPNELSFLCEILQKCHVDTETVVLTEFLMPQNGENTFSLGAFLRERIHRLRPKTVYKAKDPYGFCYRVLLLPDEEPATVLRVGPYLDASVTEEQLWEIGERNGIPPSKQRYLAEYSLSVPVIPAESPLWIAFGSFCERLWGDTFYSVREISPDVQRKWEEKGDRFHDSDGTDVLLNVKAMERRYTFENQLIRSVELGQLHMENQLTAAFSADLFEKRATDPLRNAKNYTIIMNTLLRKAAERGGVHPLHIDRVSSEIAMKIEEMAAVSETQEMMVGIFRTYCNLVREHSTRELPSIVKQTVLIIESDLSADLSPSLLAERQGISLGYLSATFKKAMNVTVSEYVRRKRMEYAAYLLRTTNLQIQTVALYSGIMDVQYFSKLFKREHGVTPTEYRFPSKAP